MLEQKWFSARIVDTAAVVESGLFVALKTQSKREIADLNDDPELKDEKGSCRAGYLFATREKNSNKVCIPSL